MLSGRQKLLGALLVGITTVLVGYSVAKSFNGEAVTNSVTEGSTEGSTEGADAGVRADTDPVDNSGDISIGGGLSSVSSGGNPAAGVAPGASAVAVSTVDDKPKNRIYTVQANDNFWSIAKKVYGDAKYVNKLSAANAGHKILRSGMRIICPPFEGANFKLDLPALDEGGSNNSGLNIANTESSAGGTDAEMTINAPTAAAGSATIGSGIPQVAAAPVTTPVATRSHTVLAGESLYDIAKKYYKNGSAWPKIAAANPTVNANAIKPGQVLQIP